ncbi:MAG: Ger(x)C family spore germination protein [Desulfotomaculaceae bacterium]|nr:Ger(x)C family spore germination protein [Desulfotomaculaceae bacterium]
MARMMVLLWLVLLLVLTQPGCWDRREAEELGIVVGYGIEPAAGGKVRLIVQVINAGAQGQGQNLMGAAGQGPTSIKSYTNLVSEGDTLFEAFRMLSTKTGARNIHAFAQVVIVSEEYAREKGLSGILDLLDRDPVTRRSYWLLIGRGDLASLLDEPGTLNPIPSMRIGEILKHQSLAAVSAPLRLGEFYRLMESESAQPFTAVVESELNQAVPGEKGHEVSEGSIPEPLRQIKLNGTAVFRQDKMVGWLNEKESRGLLWLRGEVKEGFLKSPSPGGTGKLFTAEILNTKTTLLPEIKDGEIYLTVKIKAETYLEETQEPVDSETVRLLEAAQAGTIAEEAGAALEKAQQEYRADVFGFGEAVHRKYPGEWKEMKNRWPELFPGVQVSFQVETKMRHTAMISDPVMPVEK